MDLRLNKLDILDVHVSIQPPSMMWNSECVRERKEENLKMHEVPPTAQATYRLLLLLRLLLALYNVIQSIIRRINV